MHRVLDRHAEREVRQRGVHPDLRGLQWQRRETDRVSTEAKADEAVGTRKNFHPASDGVKPVPTPEHCWRVAAEHSGRERGSTEK